MIISHEYKFIFIHIGKTGGTSIEKVLCDYLGMDFEATEISPEGEWWKHIWAKYMKEYVGEKIWNDYFTFAFVRNPLDMILSLYSMYTQYPEYTNREEYPELYHPWNQYKDFEDFILSMGECRHEPDEEWRSQLDEIGVKQTMDIWYDLENHQTSYLTNSWKGKEEGEGEILVDFVGRYENLREDFHTVCEKIGLPKLDLIHHGVTIHRPYYRLYTNKMKEIVYNHSSLDMERFGYVESKVKPI
ncbi:sulfotransferase family 2 domain-containing protein [Crocosphaera sp. XPORK-15E]|uniref:sulfotransferase family 2 domain-containing protein n=1 Tax=Crocosphaera sp. XPORK-15E TaxID=3110247 RepID=UPI002B1F0DCD|nr:sulfotransferase family 2 domain-containing protein [Crocosphaera sp. XPORK-15E]MEA5532394.1 sulfotransferase family 2 domain-containing protein [Crocosphaera sp. XPORK-15E]